MDFAYGGVSSFNNSPNVTVFCNHYSNAAKLAQAHGARVSYLDPLPEEQVSLHLPAALRAIQPEAFLGTSAIGVEIPESCASVGSRAFANASALRVLLVPSMTLSLPADIIEGSPHAWVFCYPDSQAAADCAAYGIPCKLMD